MSSPTLDETIAAALHATKFGSVARLLIEQDAQASEAAAPEFYSVLTAKLSSLSDTDIETIAVPLVRNRMPVPVANAAVTFFSSQVGRGIAVKLAVLGAPEFTVRETDELSDFSASENGANFFAAIGDPQLLVGLVQGVIGYAL
jgi:hypothetical protein